MDALAEVVRLQLSNGGKATLTVTGSSMMPMLRNRRDTVVLVPSGNEKKGDVVLFQRTSGSYVLHRIIKTTEAGYICCGDNQAEQEPIEKEQLVAVMEGFTRKGKYYDRNAAGYRLYQTVWVELFFLRRYYIWIRRRLAPIRRRLKTYLTK
jgi:hypothetical protein